MWVFVVVMRREGSRGGFRNCEMRERWGGELTCARMFLGRLYLNNSAYRADHQIVVHQPTSAKSVPESIAANPLNHLSLPPQRRTSSCSILGEWMKLSFSPLGTHHGFLDS